MFERYGFESEIYPGLSRIPLHVRMKLDVAGVKISLKVWLAFSLEERSALCHLPAATAEEREAFSSYLDFLSRRYFGEAAGRVAPDADRAWEDVNRVPAPVQARSEEQGRPVALEEWKRWSPGRRYALLKLSLSKNEPEQFFAALKEFREAIGEPS